MLQRWFALPLPAVLLCPAALLHPLLNHHIFSGSLTLHPTAQVFLCDIGQSGDEGGVVVEAGDEAEGLAAGFVELFAALDGELFQGFQAVAHEAGAEYVELADLLFGGQFGEQVGCCRAYPAGAAEAALEADIPLLGGELQGFCEQLGAGSAFDFVGVALLYGGFGDAVEAEQDALAAAMLLPVGADMCGHGLDVVGMVVETADGAQADLVALFEQFVQHLIQRGTAAAGGVLRIEGDGEQAVYALGFHGGDGIGYGRCAVGHGVPHQHLRQLGLQGGGLFGGNHGQRRAFALPDLAVAVCAFFGAEGQDDAAQQGLPQQARQLDYALVGQKFAQIGAHGFGCGCGRRAEVDEQNANSGLLMRTVRRLGLEVGHGGSLGVFLVGYLKRLDGFSDSLYLLMIGRSNRCSRM